MVSFSTLSVVALLGLSQAFDFHRDLSGGAILPPTDVVIEYLRDNAKQVNDVDYHVLNSVDSATGEVITVNLNTRETKKTGVFKRDYNNNVYYTYMKPRVIWEADSDVCFNEVDDFGVSECTFEFLNYTTPADCDSQGGSKYSCVLDVEAAQDATLKLKDMPTVAALVRCFHSLTDAKSAGVTNGACGN